MWTVSSFFSCLCEASKRKDRNATQIWRVIDKWGNFANLGFIGTHIQIHIHRDARYKTGTAKGMHGLTALMHCTTASKCSLCLCSENNQFVTLWFYSTKIEITKSFDSQVLQVRAPPCESSGSQASTSEEEHFAVTLLLKVVSSFFCQRKGTQKQLTWYLEDVYSDTHSHSSCLSKQSQWTHWVFFSCAHLCSYFPFFFFFPNFTVQTITCKNSSFQSEDDKIWALNNHICNLQS